MEAALGWLKNAGLIHVLELVKNAEIVKAATNTQAKSYKQFSKKYAPKVGYKASLKNIAANMIEETNTVSIPLYLLWNMDFYNWVQENNFFSKS